MIVFPPIISLSIQPNWVIAVFLLSCQGEITKNILKFAFSIFISATIIRTPACISHSTFLSSPSVNISTTKVKTYEEDSAHKLKNFSKDLNDSNMAQVSLETGLEAQRDCCKKLYQHQTGACRGRICYPKAAKHFSISRTQLPNALHGIRIDLRMGLKQTLEGRCVAKTVQLRQLGSEQMTSARRG